MGSRIWKGKKIVIVDDSKRVRADLRAKYGDIELDVVGEASDGVEAIELIEKQMPELVSLDIIMPEMNGFEVFDRVKDSFPHIRCFFVSCLASEPKVKESCQSRYGIDCFFTKPLDVKQIQDWLFKYASSSASHKLKIAS